MFRDLKFYKHEFFTLLYLDPPTRDKHIDPPHKIERIDYLLVKDLIKIGRIKPGELKPVSAEYAILTEPKTGTVVFEHPYIANIEKARDLKKLTIKEAADALDPLVKLRDKYQESYATLQQLLEFLEHSNSTRRV